MLSAAHRLISLMPSLPKQVSTSALPQWYYEGVATGAYRDLGSECRYYYRGMYGDYMGLILGIHSPSSTREFTCPNIVEFYHPLNPNPKPVSCVCKVSLSGMRRPISGGAGALTI